MDNPEVESLKHRWLVISASFIIMMVISIYQYSWFLFAYSLEKQFAWNPAVIGTAFTIFAVAATFIQPFSGMIADSYGPRKIALFASFLAGVGFILCAYASLPHWLYICYGLGGVGVGILYGISTACAVKWFPDRRGFAAGLVVFGFGAGTALFNFIIQALLESKGLSYTFFSVGICILIILLPLSLLLKYPSHELSLSPGAGLKKTKQEVNFRPREMLKTYQWYLIYFSFAVTVSIVLMFGAQMKMLAREFAIPDKYFSLVLVLFPLGNGLSRVFAGIVSDKIGREKTMILFYSVLGLAILAFVMLAHIPALFVLIVFLASLLGGAPFALYPATIGDYYGSKFATTNYGITYTAKAWAGLISGSLSGYLVMEFGSYRIALAIIAVCCFIAAVLSNRKWLKMPHYRKEADAR